MEYEIVWTRSAEADLNEIIEYIAKDSINIALEKFFKIREAVEKAAQYPEKSRIIPELKEQNINKYREMIYPPWRIFFRIDKGTISILAVIDGRRNIEEILLQRQLR